jgi:Methyltransferase domain
MTNSPFVTINLAAAEVAAYRAAVQLGLLDRIDRAPATADEAANSCGISRRGAHAVLTALHHMAVLDRDEFGCYRPLTAGLASLHPMIESWAELPNVVRVGAPAVPCDTPDSAGRHYPATVGHLSTIQLKAAEEVASLLPPAARVLDVGAGAAPWSLAYARRHLHCSITALDLAGVLPVTRRAVHAAGLAQRFDYLAGDVFSVPLPDVNFGLIIVGNFCHLFDATTNRVCSPDSPKRCAPAAHWRS